MAFVRLNKRHVMLCYESDMRVIGLDLAVARLVTNLISLVAQDEDSKNVGIHVLIIAGSLCVQITPWHIGRGSGLNDQ